MEYVLSDIHGNLDAWRSINAQICLKPDDSLYVLGDVIDRGAYGIDILKEIIRTPNMHMLLGNHEYMMMNALGFPYAPNDLENTETYEDEKFRLWEHNGGKSTLSCYNRLPETEKKEIRDYLKALPLNLYTTVNGTRYVLTHASWEKLYDLLALGRPEDRAYFCVWDRDEIGKLINYVDGINESGKPTEIIIGHTPTSNFVEELNELENDGHYMSVFKYHHLMAIDCGAGWTDKKLVKGGRLACLRLDDGKILYSAG